MRHMFCISITQSPAKHRHSGSLVLLMHACPQLTLNFTLNGPVTQTVLDACPEEIIPGDSSVSGEGASLSVFLVALNWRGSDITGRALKAPVC